MRVKGSKFARASSQPENASGREAAEERNQRFVLRRKESWIGELRRLVAEAGEVERDRWTAMIGIDCKMNNVALALREKVARKGSRGDGCGEAGKEFTTVHWLIDIHCCAGNAVGSERERSFLEDTLAEEE